MVRLIGITRQLCFSRKNDPVFQFCGHFSPTQASANFMPTSGRANYEIDKSDKVLLSHERSGLCFRNGKSSKHVLGLKKAFIVTSLSACAFF